MITYEWIESLNCSLCNPAGAPGLATGGVRVTGPHSDDHCRSVCICEECLGVLDSMAFVDRYERPHAPEALAAIGTTERGAVTRVHVRRSGTRGASQSFSHRAGLVVAVKHVCQQWRARAAQVDRTGARCLAGGEALESVEARLGVVSATLRQCADEVGKLVQPDTRVEIISEYPKGEPCAVTNE